MSFSIAWQNRRNPMFGLGQFVPDGAVAILKRPTEIVSGKLATSRLISGLQPRPGDTSNEMPSREQKTLRRHSGSIPNLVQSGLRVFTV